MSDEKSLKDRYEKAGQKHIFDHFETLKSDDRESLLKQLASIQVEHLGDLLRLAQAGGDSGAEDGSNSIEPFIGENVGSFTDVILNEKCNEKGLEAIGRGEVAALVLAGGQGTRLGFDGPKGMYDIGLPSHKSLFQLMAERISKLKKLAASKVGIQAKDCSLPFYIMTSPINHDATKQYFLDTNFFGLGEENVFLFQQGMLPCLTKEGKIIMETASTVSMAPDGNGGIYPSLLGSGALDDMEKSRGIKYLHVFSIDNALVKPADPGFLGFCIDKGADCGNKSTWKSHAHEKVGVVALRGGKPCVVEYSEITQEMAERTDAQGRLAFGAGNICNHFYTIEFLRKKVLPNMGNMYHIAQKKIPYYDATKQATVKPDSNNGIKLETFIFDVFSLSESFAVWEVERSQEFAPVKNAQGSSSDSPDTARTLISCLCKSWLTAAGAEISSASDEDICEISPLLSFGGEGLEQYKGGTIQVPCHLTS
mmetsp:Transcript_6115/g.7910  ORF Transcript_6115/g.7910 Transcript_6115/m.7910 type:complete len:480 (+) Transcript_6115:27-1466(+)